MMLRQAQHEGRGADTQAEAMRLRRIRAALEAIAPGKWSRAHDGISDLVEAVSIEGDRVPLLRFDARATGDEMNFVADAARNARFLLELIERASVTVLALRRAQEAHGESGAGQGAAGPVADERRNYAAEAAMKCGESGFKVFLEQCHGLERPLTDERTAQKLRSLLGVTSRRELNSNDAAAARWKKLRGAYETWRRAQR